MQFFGINRLAMSFHKILTDFTRTRNFNIRTSADAFTGIITEEFDDKNPLKYDPDDGNTIYLNLRKRL